MFKLLGQFKEYVRSDGGENGYSKNVRKRSRGFFKEVFSHLICLFLFFTSLMGE